MAVREYVHIAVRFWWVIVGAVVICATAGFVYGQFIQSVTYVSTSKLFVSAEGGTSVGESYQNNLFAEARVNSYAQIATSDQVAQRASRALNGEVGAGELKSSTTATPVDKTVILEISVTAGSAARAQSEAAAVARETVNVVQELETSRRGGEPAATAIVYDEASLPGSPSGLPAWMLAGLGAAAGLIVGVVIALLLGLRQRRRIGGADDLADTAARPVLSVIPDDPERENALLITDLDQDGQGDAYRDLRNAVRFRGARLGDGQAPRVVAVVGVGSGVGASSVAANLAGEIAASGRSVLLVDGHLRAARAAGSSSSRHSSLSEVLAPDAASGLSTVLTDETELLAAVVGVGSLSFLPSGPAPSSPGELLGSRELDTALGVARQHFDFVVIDAGPAGPDATVFTGLADGTVLVARRGRTTRTALRAALESADSVGVAIGTVLTFAGNRPQRSPEPTEPTPEEVTDDEAPEPNPVEVSAASPSLGEPR
ncbi:polysaccharide biosynthesis tyrosine autokinase [Gordonia sp. NPDC003504]